MLTGSRQIMATLVSITLLATVTACSSSSAAANAGDSSAPLAHLVPKTIMEKGTVSVATTAFNAPFESLQNGEIVGFDVDMANDVGRRLGLKFKFVNTAFDGIVPAIQGGRFDLAISEIYDTPARAKIVDLIDYAKDGSILTVPKGNPMVIKTPEDLCGHTVAVITGSAEAASLAALQKECVGTQITTRSFPELTSALSALISGRSDVLYGPGAGSAVAVAKSGGGLETLGTLTESHFVGIVVPKSEAQFRDAIMSALKAMIEDGSYAKLLAKYNIKVAGLSQITLNGK